MSAISKADQTVKTSVLHVQDVPSDLLRDIGIVARMRDKHIKVFVRELLEAEVEKTLRPKKARANHD